MNIKKIQHYAVSLLAAVMVMGTTFSFAACGGDGDDNSSSGGSSSGGGTSVNIVLRSQSIQEGAEMDAATTTVLTLEYNTTVSVVAGGDITLNDSKVAAKSNSLTTMKVDIPLVLQEGTDYTVKVGKGAIVSAIDNKTSAPELTLHFKTLAKTQPVATDIPAAPLTASTDAAKKLYTYFYDQYGKKIVSSVMADVNWNNECAEKVYRLTGNYPAMNCYDFIHIQVPDGNGWIDYSNITPVTDWVEKGGMVQLMWHFNVPKSESTVVGKDGSGVTCSPGETSFKASNALVSGTWENRYFYAQMDRVIAVILKLQEAGIAATWRPFHEAAGNATAKQQADWTKAWFWWGSDGSETFKKLWVAMYDYFQQKGVNNLIWIWTTQNCNGNSSVYHQDTGWYPGDGYCDMVARDLYGCDAAKNAQEFREIQAAYPNKMVVLGECGWDGSDKTGRPQGDIVECWNQGAKWGLFMMWYDRNAGNKTDTMVSDVWWQSALNKENAAIVVGK